MLSVILWIVGILVALYLLVGFLITVRLVDLKELDGWKSLIMGMVGWPVLFLVLNDLWRRD